MKIYTTQKEVDNDIKNYVLAITDNVKFDCSISIEASIFITAGNIIAENITAWDINARNITAENINAEDINAWNIIARNIDAWNINAWNINARDIDAKDINARNITARDIVYDIFCCVYQSIKCLSIRANREIHQAPICLEGKLEIKEVKS